MKKIIKVCLIGAGGIGFKLENDLKRKNQLLILECG